ncbi:MAG: HD domain-containing protein [Bacilli bacterium]
MIDIEKVKQTFEKYIKQNYDLNDEEVKRKYSHSLNVANLSKEIVKNSNILFEDAQSLSELIGLLHDIGVFNVIKENNIDHVGEGLKILFDENNIKSYIKERNYDEIIKSAIYNHNKLELAPFLSDDEKLFCNILRDADKIDILKTVAEKNEAISPDETISENMIKHIKEHKTIPNNLLTNKTEELIYVIAYIFDIKYKYSFYMIEENGYIEKIVKKLNIDSNEKVKFIYNEIKSFIRNSIGERYHAE